MLVVLSALYLRKIADSWDIIGPLKYSHCLQVDWVRQLSVLRAFCSSSRDSLLCFRLVSRLHRHPWCSNEIACFIIQFSVRVYCQLYRLGMHWGPKEETSRFAEQDVIGDYIFIGNLSDQPGGVVVWAGFYHGFY